MVFWGDYYEELPPPESDSSAAENGGRHRRPYHDAYHNLHSRFRLGTTLMRLAGWELPDGSLNTELLARHNGLERVDQQGGGTRLVPKQVMEDALEFLHGVPDADPREHFRWLLSPYGIGRHAYRMEWRDELAGRELNEVLRRQSAFFDMLHEHRGEAQREQTYEWRKHWIRLWGRETLAEVALFHLPMLETSEGLLHEPSLTKYTKRGEPKAKQPMLRAYRKMGQGLVPPMQYLERVLEYISAEEARASKIELLSGRSLGGLQHRIRNYEGFLMSTRYTLNRPPKE